MTENDFRKLALALPGAEERGHMGHPDFRAGGKIFATLGYPREGWGMVKLFPDQQEKFVASDPDAFVPVKGAWGKRGATSVNLRAAKKTAVREALALARQNTAPKKLTSAKPGRSRR